MDFDILGTMGCVIRVGNWAGVLQGEDMYDRDGMSTGIIPMVRKERSHIE